MSVVYCVMCRKKHEDFEWRYQKWEGKEGWACRKWFKISAYPEMVPQRIKDDRVKHSVDILQPYRGGEPNRDFIKHYPVQSKKIFTPKEIKNAL